MPVVHIRKEVFEKHMGVKTSEELHILSFEFGIEFEEKEVVEESKDGKKKKQNKYIEYIFEVAANRPDLLCLEGLIIALQIYLKQREIPHIQLIPPQQQYQLVIDKSVKQVRPYAMAAIIRNIKFDPVSYLSFIDFQDKLHQNICRKRKLVSMGTHDLDKLKGTRFTYEGQKPEDIKFVPLKIDESVQEKEMNSNQILNMYKQHNQLKEFVHLIENSPVHPVIRDADGQVMSLPPIINSDYSKISEDTKNIFIDITALDKNRANIVLNQLISNFGLYCDFKVEQVEIIDGENSFMTPDLGQQQFKTSLKSINNMGNFQVSKEQVHGFLKQMMIIPVENDKDSDEIVCNIPICRSDILQECDILEDICIAYGYNNIKKEIPSSFTLGSQLFINKMSNLLREQIAQSGYTENLNFILCSANDLTAKIANYKGIQPSQFVELGNYKLQDYSVVRNTLVPGMLKWLQHNKTSKLPLKLFEIGDICVKDPSHEVGAKNQRNICAIYSNQNSELELIHGLLDFIMSRLNFRKGSGKGKTYKLEGSEDELFFKGIGANVIFDEEVVGVLGIISPTVCENYEWKYPISLVELNLSKLIEKYD